ELPADLDTPLSAYLRLRPGPYSFLLESVEGGETWARYSFLGTEPRLVLTAKNGRMTLRHADGHTERVPDGNPLDAIRDLLRSGHQRTHTRPARAARADEHAAHAGATRAAARSWRSRLRLDDGRDDVQRRRPAGEAVHRRGRRLSDRRLATARLPPRCRSVHG